MIHRGCKEPNVISESTFQGFLLYKSGRHFCRIRLNKTVVGGSHQLSSPFINFPHRAIYVEYPVKKAGPRIDIKPWVYSKHREITLCINGAVSPPDPGGIHIVGIPEITIMCILSENHGHSRTVLFIPLRGPDEIAPALVNAFQETLFSSSPEFTIAALKGIIWVGQPDLRQVQCPHPSPGHIQVIHLMGTKVLDTQGVFHNPVTQVSVFTAVKQLGFMNAGDMCLLSPVCGIEGSLCAVIPGRHERTVEGLVSPGKKCIVHVYTCTMNKVAHAGDLGSTQGGPGRSFDLISIMQLLSG